MTGSGGIGKRRNEIHVALRWKRGGGERTGEIERGEARRGRERERGGGEGGGRRWRKREGEVGKSHTAVNEPPPTPSADCTYVRTYVSYVTCVRTYVRRYVSTWKSLPTVHPLSRCCFRGVLHRSNGAHGVYTRLAAEALSSSPPLPPSNPSSRSSASSSILPPPLFSLLQLFLVRFLFLLAALTE